MQGKKSNVFIILVVVCMIMTQFQPLAAQEISEDNYVIYSAKTGKKTDVAKIVKDSEDYDIILFGEEHNDAVTHYLESELLQKLFEKYGDSLTLSMEMFDRDVQVVLNEFLAGMISEKHFIKDARVWVNYSDYRPMVDFAKENNIYIIAANAPMRYTNMASMKGQESLQSLSETAKTFIAPLPYDTATGAHREKLMQVLNEVKMPVMKKDTVQKPMMPPAMQSFNINLGQSLWNATMAYSLYEFLAHHSGQKLLHLQGKFHSDEYFGVPDFLQKYDPALKYLVITTLSDDAFPNINFKQYNGLADYIIVTDPSIPRTFSQ
jgi:uncharacterized iron-regulated protein